MFPAILFSAWVLYRQVGVENGLVLAAVLPGKCLRVLPPPPPSPGASVFVDALAADTVPRLLALPIF